MNKLMRGLKEENNFNYTENGAVTYKSTLNGVLDLFSMGAAYRNRSDEDCIVLFKKAWTEDPVYALKCLFYLRDIREGQGERRFFKVVCKWLADYQTAAMLRNIHFIPSFGRWDDLYVFVGTKLEGDALSLMHTQFNSDMRSIARSSTEAVSLLGKWLKSENSSSKETKKLATITRNAFGLTARDYRTSLSILRERIHVLERLMSAGEWDKIEFDKIPSRAGLIYRNAFARHDVERAIKNARTYEDFITDDSTTVNARALYPYEVVEKALFINSRVDRAAVNKYWENLHDYFEGCSLDALCMVDTSASMMWGVGITPIHIAISLGLYCADKSRGPFAGHYISFSRNPQLIETEGYDFVDKVRRIERTCLCENTNIEAAFDMLLNTAEQNHCSQEDLPKTIIIVSDMEFDCGVCCYSPRQTLMESIRDKWTKHGYIMPNLVFWNVNARNNNIPMKVENGITMVSGASPVTFQMVMTGKTGYDLMMDKLNSPRYECIH